MCGKFTAMASWRGVHDFSQPLTLDRDNTVIYRPMTALPVIVFDKEARQRRIVPMRWGFPDRKNWRVPKPIHARSETIETTKAFADSFHDGHHGIVVFKTFNEGKEISASKTEQWTIDPGDGVPRGFAFLWRGFDIVDSAMHLMACVMVTVPASTLIAPITERMPAILEDQDWAKWLGEEDVSVADLKAVLKTRENVRWTMAPEVKAAKSSP